MNKLEYVSGCTCDSLTINGKETIDMQPSEIQEHLINMIKTVTDISYLQDLLMCIAEYGEYEDLGHCEQCGDYISKYTYEY